MRMSKSVKQALLPSMICLGLITGVIGLIGLYAGLATGDPDPSISFVKVTGLWMGIIAVIFIALANIGTAIVGVYATMHRPQADPGAAVPPHVEVDGGRGPGPGGVASPAFLPSCSS